MPQLSASQKNLLQLLLTVLVGVALFLYLPTLSIRMWDESRLAVNAAEMLQNGNWMVTYYKGAPDMWNTKPPLMIWLQAGFMHLLGINEWAVRLPSALAGAATFLLVYFFTLREFKNILIAALAVLVLVCSSAYISHHVTRTGDYDALLTLFITAYALAFYKFLNTRKLKYLAWFTLAVLLSGLTKGVAGFMCLPGLLLYTIFRKQLLPVLKTKEIYLAILVIAVVVVGYYLLREQQNPGYLQAVYENELGGRYLNAIEEHNRPWWYYLVQGKFIPWLALLPVYLYFIYRPENRQFRNFNLFSLCFAVPFFLLITTAKTKLPWYDAPLYPITSILAGLGFYLMLAAVAERYRIRQKTAFFLIAMALIFSVPYALILTKFIKKTKNDPEGPALQYGYLLRSLNAEQDSWEKYKVLSKEEYNAALDFYVLKNRLEGITITEKRVIDIPGLQTGEKVISCYPELLAAIQQTYQTEVIKQTKTCSCLKIGEKIR